MSQQGSTWKAERVIPSDPAAGKQVLDELLAQLHSKEWIEHDIFGIHLSMEEALVNAIKHGNRHDPSKQVHVNCQVSRDKVRIEITDEGPGFKPEEVPDCTDIDRLDVPSGRGIMLMRSFMSFVEYSDRGNTVVMEKERASETSE